MLKRKQNNKHIQIFLCSPETQARLHLSLFSQYLPNKRLKTRQGKLFIHIILEWPIVQNMKPFLLFLFFSVMLTFVIGKKMIMLHVYKSLSKLWKYFIYILICDWCKKINSLLRGGDQQSSMMLTGRVIFLLFSHFFLSSLRLSVSLLGQTTSSQSTKVFFIYWGQSLPIWALSDRIPEPIKRGGGKVWTLSSSLTDSTTFILFRHGLAWWLLCDKR